MFKYANMVSPTPFPRNICMSKVRGAGCKCNTLHRYDLISVVISALSA